MENVFRQDARETERNREGTDISLNAFSSFVLRLFAAVCALLRVVLSPVGVVSVGVSLPLAHICQADYARDDDLPL